MSLKFINVVVYYRYKTQKSMYRNFHDTFQWSLQNVAYGQNLRKRKSEVLIFRIKVYTCIDIGNYWVPVVYCKDKCVN